MFFLKMIWTLPGYNHYPLLLHKQITVSKKRKKVDGKAGGKAGEGWVKQRGQKNR